MTWNSTWKLDTIYYGFAEEYDSIQQHLDTIYTVQYGHYECEEQTEDLMTLNASNSLVSLEWIQAESV